MTDNTPILRAQTPSMLLDPVRFEAAQRAGKMMALSALFPAHLRQGSTDVAVANAVLVMNIADRMREDPLAVAQNIYFVQGKPGWNASYMISRANQSGVFRGPIRWKSAGEGVDLEVTAYAKMADDGEVVEIKVSMNMAKLEGWTKNTKYASMPEQMLRYRAATFLIRLYCPEVMLGYQTVEEIEDVSAAQAKDITPHDPATGEVVEADAKPAATSKPDVEDAEVEDEKPKADRRAAQKAYKEGQKKSAPKATKPKESENPAPAEEKPADPVDDAGDAPGPFDETKLADEISGPFAQVKDAIVQANNIGEMEGMIELFNDALAYMADVDPAAREELQRLEDERREVLAGGESA